MQSTESSKEGLPAGHVPVNLHGQVVVQPAAHLSQKDVQVHLKLQTSSPILQSAIKLEQTSSQLSIRLPRSGLTPDLDSHQLDIDVTAEVHVPRNASLESLETATTALDVRFLPDPIETNGHETGTGSATNSLGSSNGHSPPSSSSSSRRTIIKSTSGGIFGTYELLDLLHLETKSGSIGVDVVPRAASPTKPVAAQFTALTSSGMIHVDFPEDSIERHIPTRDYHVRVASKSGSISGRCLLGRQASFTSRSGSLLMTLLPVSPRPGVGSELYTSTRSGSTDLRIRSPLPGMSNPLRSLNGDHRSGSGSLRLRYPPEWEGEIRGRTGSGQLHVRGDGLSVIEDTPAGYRARKGLGEAVLSFEGQSGSIDISV